MDKSQYHEIVIYRRVRKSGLLLQASDPAMLAALVARLQGAIGTCVLSSDWVGGMRLTCVHSQDRREDELYRELHRWLGQEGWEPVYDDMLEDKPSSAGGYYACRLRRPIECVPPATLTPASGPARPLSLAEQRRRLAVQHNAGTLDDAQYEAAKRTLLESTR